MSKFKKVNVAGDGACYFHAVVGFLDMERLVKDKKTYYKKGLDKEASDLRKKVVTWLRNNLTFQYENGLTIQDDIEDEIRNNPKIQSINDYLRDMSRPSAYAGQIEITATANILKRNIRVFIKKQGEYSNVGLGYEINQSKDKDITLFHNMGTSKGSGKHHFEILFPTSKAQVVTKTNYDKLRSKVKYKMKRTGRANKRTKRKPVKRSKTRKQKKGTRVRRRVIVRGGSPGSGVDGSLVPSPTQSGTWVPPDNDAPVQWSPRGGLLAADTTLVKGQNSVGDPYGVGTMEGVPMSPFIQDWLESNQLKQRNMDAYLGTKTEI